MNYLAASSYRKSLLTSLPSSSKLLQRNFASNEKLFDKLLVANRGEIACRIFRSCKKLGIKTVAVYSEADAQSLHVQQADEAICIGPPDTRKSYLNMDAIVDAVLKTKAQAVHPGYGFLSENTNFAAALEKENVAWVGPNSESIKSMSDKISCKAVAKKANVTAIPGFLGVIKDDDELIEVARKIGYPVMIKAVHGGGGKGMRIAWNDKEAVEGFRLSTAEALTSFGNSAIFVEKYIEQPRHIEVQLIGDKHGNVVYLNERECTIQRRNQKVIEEAPSPFLDAATRHAMGEQAVKLAKTVGYHSAGTCEFLVDKHRNFYFLEMNTRLQVEHPITELTTGVDIVEQMIRVAAGHKLPFTQADIGEPKGWAFESRVYAEDPLRGFLPCIGRLSRYQEPSGPGIRCDAGVREGSEISIFYDPMISKVITYGPTRGEALQTMRDALDSFVIRGVTHNVAFLRSLCDHPRYISGDMSTAFIPQEYPQGFKGHQLSLIDKEMLVAAGVEVFYKTVLTQSSISGKQATFNAAGFTADKISKLVVLVGEERFNVESTITKEGLKMKFQREGDSTAKEVDFTSNYNRGDVVFQVELEGQHQTIQVISAEDGNPALQFQYKGSMFPVTVYTPREFELSKYMPVKETIDTSKVLLSPMPGAVFSVAVNVGDQVVPGQEVCVVEAMKMQNVLRAENSGKVKTIKVKKGQTVAADEILVEFE